LTEDEIEAHKAAGAAVEAARRQKDRTAGRAPDEMKRVRCAAHETAAYCADCFKPLAANASVTMVKRFIEHEPEHVSKMFGIPIPARDHYERVPICLVCWLAELTALEWSWYSRGLGNGPPTKVPKRQDAAGPNLEYSDERVHRFRCTGCGRPMRVIKHLYRSIRAKERCCCRQCFYDSNRRRDNERRHVRRKPKTCVVCGEKFTPRKSTASTCSGKCRIRLFRQRQSAVKPDKGRGAKARS
jgi:hypothetical protein